MEHDLVLEGKVVSPGGIRELEVGVTDGKVAELGHGLKGTRKIHAERALIFPGFIDIHVHLREPGWERKEDFRTGTEAAAHGGVTTVVDMPNNPVPATTRAVLEEKARLAGSKGVVDVKFHGGIDGEDPEGLGRISDQVVGYKLYLSETTGTRPFPPSGIGAALRAVAGTGKPLSVHCEDQQVIDRAVASLRGEVRQDLHCDLRPLEAETSAVGEVLRAMETAGRARVNVCHASGAETLRLVKEAKGGGLGVSCEATLHHLYYNRGAMLRNALLKTNPPLRSEEDRRAMVQGVRSGEVAFLVTDHAPHLEEEKRDGGAAGVPGLDDYAHLVSWLVREEDVRPEAICAAAAASPAAHLGLGDRGEISPGRRGDFSIVDVRSPERVRGEEVRSRCGWSPYEGIEFPGRARWTISAGEVVLDDYELAV